VALRQLFELQRYDPDPVSHPRDFARERLLSATLHYFHGRFALRPLALTPSDDVAARSCPVITISGVLAHGEPRSVRLEWRACAHAYGGSDSFRFSLEVLSKGF
jgi:hypothetical protein